MTNTYKIVRTFARNHTREIINTGLTLAEAMAHCAQTEASSKTAMGLAAQQRTIQHGEWYDGYLKETGSSEKA